MVTAGRSYDIALANALKRCQFRTSIAGVALDLSSLAQLFDLEVGRKKRSADLLNDSVYVLALLCAAALLGAAHD